MEHIRDAKHLPGFPLLQSGSVVLGKEGRRRLARARAGAGQGRGTLGELRFLMPFLSHPCFPSTKPASSVLLLLLAFRPSGAHRHPFWVPL